MSSKTKQIYSCHCINMRRAANTISKIYDDFLQPAGISANQFSLLVSLNEIGSATYSELARYIGLERSTITRTVRPLEERGLIVDISVPGTKKSQLRLSKSGEKKLLEAQVLWEKAQEETEKKIGLNNIKGFEEAFRSLIENQG